MDETGEVDSVFIDNLLPDDESTSEDDSSSSEPTSSSPLVRGRGYRQGSRRGRRREDHKEVDALGLGEVVVSELVLEAVKPEQVIQSREQVVMSGSGAQRSPTTRAYQFLLSSVYKVVLPLKHMTVMGQRTSSVCYLQISLLTP